MGGDDRLARLLIAALALLGLFLCWLRKRNSGQGT